MFSIKELKTDAKSHFKSNYWMSVLVSVILSVFVSASYNLGTSSSESEVDIEALTQGYSTEELMVLLAVFAGTLTIALIIATLVNVFLVNPYKVGLVSFFSKNANETKPKFMDTFVGFKNYKHVISTMFMRDLIVSLFTLLLIVPGIIKHYEYCLVPYILTDYPEKSWKEALATSKEWMQGNKKRAFLLDLSQIGLAILSIIPIASQLWARPVMNQIDAQLYLTLKK